MGLNSRSFCIDLQVDSSGRKVPSWLQRCLTVLLSCTALPVAELILTKYSNRITSFNQPALSLLKTVLEKRPLLMLAIARVCLSIFYLSGKYYEVSKLVTRVEYRKLSAKPPAVDNGSGFTSLGFLNLLKSAVLFGTLSYTLSQVLNNVTPSPVDDTDEVTSQTDVAPQDLCSLCYGERVHSSVTPCGHLFCWSCVHEWIATKPECPLCRDEVNPKHVILLQN